jgi:hypothetical protein
MLLIVYIFLDLINIRRMKHDVKQFIYILYIRDDEYQYFVNQPSLILLGSS